MTRATVPFPDVTVVLGDPRLPDVTKVDHRFSREDLESVARMKAALAQLPSYRFTYLDDHAKLLPELLARPPSFVLNFCDTGYRNDAAHELHVPAFLECLDIPYSGADPSCMSLCYDKALVRALAAQHGIPVPREIYVDADAEPAIPPEMLPALIKPNRGDGSVGITQEAVVRTPDEARSYLDRLRREWPGRAALVQEFLGGPEYGTALIGNPGLGFTALPALEVDYIGLDAGLPRILGYESKTVPASPYWTQIKFRQARLDDETRRRLVGYSQTMFERLGCRDYARFDFRTDPAGEIKLLEVNANPAWCWDGKLNLMAGFAGYRYPDLLRSILETAQARAAAG